MGLMKSIKKVQIVGDDLYGEASNRLHLHAGYLQFIHPVKKTEIEFTSEADF